MAAVVITLLQVTLLLACQLVDGQTVSPVVNTRVGTLVGIMSNDTAALTTYKGIPYAEPPVGPLRFAKPAPKEPWQDVLNATDYGPICPQTRGQNLTKSEDCLTLNLFVPKVNVSSDVLFPVMVWIHGGGFIAGAGSFYDGSILAVFGRVIVVTLNYRLGVLGFLSTGDDSAKGNYGLWDQRLAIQWVKEHIGNFHGDADKITIFGESAGAISVAMQAATPRNDRNLFQRAILESGTANNLFTLSLDVAMSRARHLGEALQCTDPEESWLLMECLRAASVNDILAVTFNDFEIYEFTPFYPTTDGDFLPDIIHKLLALGNSAQYDYIVGANSDEGSLFLFGFPTQLDSAGVSLLISKIMGPICECDNHLELTETAKFMYTAGTGLADKRRNVATVLEVAGDSVFLAPAAVAARDHSRSSNKYKYSTNTYMYYFTYLSEAEESPYPSDLIDGAGHTGEISYVFGKYLISHPGSVSASLSESMIAFWTNFAKTGDPNGEGLPEWPEFDAENETYVILEPNITTGQHLKADKIALWNDYIPTNAVPSDPNAQCSIDIPVRNGTVDKPDTTKVDITNGEGYKLGSVIGSLRVVDEAMGGEEIAEFLGIPYAKPPLGDLRFRPPQDTGQWGDEPIGIPEMLPPACPQNVTRDPWMVRLGFNQTSEDCLTLNIHTPTSGGPLPVVVYIHPGFGISGTSSIYDAVLLASKLKAVVVIVNYRLGALGFLTTGDEEAPGNYGLHDVLAALNWVKKYIGSFGGDAGRIAVIGYGAGAELTHFLALSDKAKDLFQRAVLMSSTAISPPLDNQIQPNASEKAQALAKAMDCPIINSELMIKCLRDKPASDLVLQTQNPKFGRAFPVVVDQDILTDSPINLMKAGKINNVDLIVGMTWDENAGQSFQFLPSNLSYCVTADEIKQIIGEISLLSFHNPDLATVALATEYLGKGGLDDSCQTRGSFRQFMQDYLTLWSTLETARLHSDNGNAVYVYSFDHEPLKHYTSFLPPLAGPSYADDLQFLFGDPYSHLMNELKLSYRLRDRKMSLEVMTSLGNFVHDGYPGKSLSGAEWPIFDSDNFKFMTLDSCPDARSGLEIGWDHTLRFWSDLIPSLIAPPTPTPPPKPTISKPCIVGENIGLHLSVREATTLIEAMIGVSIGLLILAVFFLGGCVAYRARAINSESSKMGDYQMTDGTYIGENPYRSKNGIDNIVRIEANESESVNLDS